MGISSRAERQPLDIYMMLDRSESMDEPLSGATETKWQAVTAALTSFVEQPMDGTSLGLQYFPLEVQQRVSCTATDYATPEVELGPLVDTAPLIRSSMQARALASGTPTSAALQGAVDHARAWAADPARAGHTVVVLLATDGAPNKCDRSLANINAIAAAGLAGTPSIRTFVIGVGDLRSNLDGIARAGGTTSAFIVDPGADLNAAFLKALNDIRGAIGCTYAIPPPPGGQTLDFARVNVTYKAGGATTPAPFAQVQGAAACGTRADAWFYDDPAAPKSIVLCPSACQTIEADAKAAVEIVLGCSTNYL